MEYEEITDKQTTQLATTDVMIEFHWINLFFIPHIFFLLLFYLKIPGKYAFYRLSSWNILNNFHALWHWRLLINFAFKP